MSVPAGGRVTFALNLELAHGRHGASARVEIDERGGETEAQLAVLGWIDRVAFGRLDRTLDELQARGVRRLTFDGSRLHHIDHAVVRPLVAALERFRRVSGACRVQGLSRHLGDVFRLAGWNAEAGSGRAPRPSLEARREWAS